VIPGNERSHDNTKGTNSEHEFLFSCLFVMSWLRPGSLTVGGIHHAVPNAPSQSGVTVFGTGRRPRRRWNNRAIGRRCCRSSNSE
jgi:hypothetical protein